MKKIADFLRARRRFDCVKVALILLTAAVYFAVSAIAAISSFAVAASRSVDYILLPDSESGFSEAKISDLRGLDGVLAISLERRYTIEIDGEQSTAPTVTELSAEYLAKCYDIQGGNTSDVFYANDTALETLPDTSGKDEIGLSFSVDGGMVQTARFVRCRTLPDSAALIVHPGSSATLERSTAGYVRIRFSGADISGIRKSLLSQKGYSVSNDVELVRADCEKEIMLCKLQMNSVAALFAVVGVVQAYMLYLRRKSCND